MMRVPILIAVLFLSQSFLASALAEERLDEEAIRAKIVGNTITIVTKALKLATGFVEEDGKIRGHIGGENFEGQWFIKDGKELCFDLPEETFDICRIVVEAGPHINLFTTTGTPGGRAEILKGNPYNL